MCLKLLQDSCSEAMIRLFVFFLNFLFIIVGVALACIGIWMEVEYTKIEVCNFFYDFTHFHLVMSVSP